MSHMDTLKSDPGSLYQAEAETAKEETSRWLLREQWISRGRLLTFFFGLGLGWFVFGSHQIDAIWMLPPTGIFLILLVVHDRCIRQRNRSERILDFYERGIGRLNHTWPGQGLSGEAQNPPGHPYANDLDIFGEGSIFELLCTARTQAGQGVLAGWLLEPSSCHHTSQRHEAIRELTDRVSLRQELWLLGPDMPDTETQTDLEAWATAPLRFSSRALTVVGATLTGLTLAAAAGWIWSGIGLIPLVAALLTQSLFALALRHRVSSVIAASQAPG
ncbi:hypothetical protein MK280_11890, partial [Myxococcota bacterium]|nr:hypothetical protein [Myxococcota bacterium]